MVQLYDSMATKKRYNTANFHELPREGINVEMVHNLGNLFDTFEIL